MKILTKAVIFTSIVLSFPVLANTGYIETKDSDGCWDARHEFAKGGGACLDVKSADWLSKGKIKVVYENNCSYRIYAKFCHEKNGAADDCGSSGINPGSTKSWVTVNASGGYSYNAVGSTSPGQDWVCARRFHGNNW